MDNHVDDNTDDNIGDKINEVKPPYICEKCGLNFGNRKSNFNSHINRKKPCVPPKLEKLDKIVKIENYKKEETKDMKTFVDLYKYLISRNESFDLIEFLKENWDGKDKQESIFRLFAFLKLIPEFDGYNICDGNFSKGNLSENIDELDKLLVKNIKDKGDKSDLTLINENIIIATTSKNMANYSIDDLDIRDIQQLSIKFKKYKLRLCIVVKNKDELMKKCNSGRISSNIDLVKIINDKSTIIIDWFNLNQYYNVFKKNYHNITIDELIKKKIMKPMMLKFHQQLSIDKTKLLITNNNKNILWGQIQRSGKSFIMAGLIADNSFGKDKCNYLIITTAPNETIEQYKYIFENYIQFHEFNIIDLKDNKKPVLTDKNIIICSKQSLQLKIIDDVVKEELIIDEPVIEEDIIDNEISNEDEIIRTIGEEINTDDEIIPDEVEYEEIIPDEIIPDDIIPDETTMMEIIKKNTKVKQIKWLKDLKIDIRFIDESHNGGTTELAKKVLDIYGKNAISIYMSATYLKPIINYGIQKDAWVLWDLEDVQLCKTFDKSIDRIYMKHNEILVNNLLKIYSVDDIIKTYSLYPNLNILTLKLNNTEKDEIISFLKETNGGWSIDGILLLQNTSDEVVMCNDGVEHEHHTSTYKFINESEVIKLCKYIFDDSKQNCKYKINKNSFINRINEINNGYIPEQRTIMCFLPCGTNKFPIDKISIAFRDVLINITPDYEIVIVNSATNINPKTIINDGHAVAKLNKKKGVIVLAGRQCSLGITLEHCDIVILLNNGYSMDMLYQMMFRCMTETKNKKYGFVVDFNIQRVVKLLTNYANIIQPSYNYKEAIKYVLCNNIISVNYDECFSLAKNNMNQMIDNIYKYFTDDIVNSINMIENININLKDNTDYNLLNDINKMLNGRISKEKRKNKIEVAEDANIPKGLNKKDIEKIIEQNNNPDIMSRNITLLKEIIKKIIPIICVLTINDKTLTLHDILTKILLNEELKEILFNQMKIWWGENCLFINDDLINIINNLYNDNIPMINVIIEEIKNNFQINDVRKLTKIIDKYLIPSYIERKQNAEITTPYELRQQMLNLIPNDFWYGKKVMIGKTKKFNIILPVIFEPCCGKGGFLIDIIDKLMNGLTELIPDEQKRYQVIVEKCLYFSDINPLNIFICKLLINPLNKFKLNYNIGNTLDLDIKGLWNLEGFNAVIGNPPFQKSFKDGILMTGNGGGRSLWDKFVVKAIDEWLFQNGLLVFVHPSSWRKPEHYMYKYFIENNLIHLNINDEKSGIKMFNCGTRYDYYLLEKSLYKNKTTIVDELGVDINIDISKWKFLPNGDFKFMNQIFDFEQINTFQIIHSHSLYEARKKHISKIETVEHKFPCIHGMTQNGNILLYSSENKGQFGDKKVILSFGRHQYPVNDYKGEFGMSQFIFGLPIKTKQEGDKIIKAINSQQFKRFLILTKWSIFQTDSKMFNYLKKDFYKYFTD